MVSQEMEWEMDGTRGDGTGGLWNGGRWGGRRWAGKNIWCVVQGFVWYRGGSGFTGKMDEGKNGGIRVHILRRTRTNGSLRVTEDLDDRFYLTAENFFQASSPGTFVDKFDLVI